VSWGSTQSSWSAPVLRSCPPREKGEGLLARIFRGAIPELATECLPHPKGEEIKAAACAPQRWHLQLANRLQTALIQAVEVEAIRRSV
jgi:hypothetical protein